MRLQAFLWLQGLVISPHNDVPSPPTGHTKGMDILMPRIKNPQKLHDAIAQFITAATANLGSLPGITAPMLVALGAKNDILAANIAAQIAAEEAAEAATQTTGNSATDINNDWDNQVNLVRAVPALDTAIVALLGLPLRDTVITSITPNIVLSVTAVGRDNGDTEITYDTNGNKQGTTYVVTARTGANPFTMVGTSTTRRFVHHHQTPGVRMEYQIRATRGVRESANSNVAVVYA